MLAIIIVILAVVFDQISKYLVVEAASPVDSLLEGTGKWAMDFIPRVLSFSYAENKGGGWSILNGGGWERVVLLGTSLVAMGLIIYILVKFYKRHPLINVALSMILGGAIGNMIDRIRLGYVVDFLTTEFMDFPIFNVADCFVTVGAVLLAVYVIFFDAKVEKRLAAEKSVSEIIPEASAETADTTEEIQSEKPEDGIENG